MGPDEKCPRAQDHGIDWKVLNSNEKIERLQFVIKSMQGSFTKLHKKVINGHRTLEEHQHDDTGGVLVKAFRLRDNEHDECYGSIKNPVQFI